MARAQDLRKSDACDRTSTAPVLHQTFAVDVLTHALTHSTDGFRLRDPIFDAFMTQGFTEQLKRVSRQCLSQFRCQDQDVIEA